MHRRARRRRQLLSSLRAATPFGVASGVSPRAKQPAIWESPWVVLPLLFFVLGPLALPLLWRSHQFTLFWKVVLTALVTLLTVLLIGMTLIYTQQALSPLLKALEMNSF